MTLALHHIVEQAKCVALLEAKIVFWRSSLSLVLSEAGIDDEALYCDNPWSHEEHEMFRELQRKVRERLSEADRCTLAEQLEEARAGRDAERIDRYKALAELDVALAERDEARTERDRALALQKRLRDDVFRMPQCATAEDIYDRCLSLNAQADFHYDQMKSYRRLQEKLKQSLRCAEKTDDETILKLVAAAIARQSQT